MMISTRGRYALRVMIDLAEHAGEGYISMKSVAERQRISPKYMEKITPVLVEAGLLTGIHGKGGGYKLARAPKDCNVGEILRLTEGSLAPVSCLECGTDGVCNHTADCRTFPMWNELNNRINDYLNSVSLADLMKTEI